MARKVRVAAFTDLNQKKPRTVTDNLDWTCEMLDLLAYQKPDIVCLTENFDVGHTGLSGEQAAQDLYGETFTRMAERAKLHGYYIICAFVERRGEGAFNTAVVIDRDGSPIGHYDKIHPTLWELESGIQSGALSPSVIATDFGKIGCQICFDANWPRDWLALKESGAEIIFFPSAFSAGRILESIATVFHVPIVAACYPQCCRIIDRDGLTLVRQGVYQKWVIDTLDLDNPLLHLDLQWDKMEAVRKVYGPAVNIKVYQEEGWWRVYPQQEDLDILDILRDFDLEPLESYLARSTLAQEAGRLPKIAKEDAESGGGL